MQVPDNKALPRQNTWNRLRGWDRGVPNLEFEIARAQATPFLVLAMEAEVYAALVVLILSVFAFIFFNGKLSANQRLPPMKSGCIPWFGIAFEFGKAPLHYIEKTRKEVQILLSL